MRRAGRSEASGLCFDHGLEGIAAQCALLLEIKANLCQLLRRQGFFEDPAPSFLAFGLVAAEALPSRMFAETGSGALAQVGRAAGPAIGCRIVGQAGADGVELDVAMAAQHVVLAVDKASLVSALPQASGAAMPRIEQADIVRSEPLHQTANVASVGWCHEEVDMVVHQDVGMQAAMRRGQRLPQKLQVAQSIAIVEEAGQAIVAPLNYVLRDAGKIDTGEAGHACEHARAGGWLQSLQAHRAPRISP